MLLSSGASLNSSISKRTPPRWMLDSTQIPIHTDPPQGEMKRRVRWCDGNGCANIGKMCAITDIPKKGYDMRNMADIWAKSEIVHHPEVEKMGDFNE